MSNNAPLQPLSPAPDRLAGIARVVRQICLLREQGELARATRLEASELPAAVRDLRLAHGPEAGSESELRALFVVEEKRVGDAMILSELLLPRLVEGWSASAARSSVSFPAVPPAAASSRGPAPAGLAPAITDLLDAMLAAERTGRRPSPAEKRES